MNNSKTWIFAFVITIFGGVIYLRTLAPGLLYSDSAEFQTLANTLGLGHTSGYSVYILISHIFTYIPLGTPAWRVNLLSTLAAIGTGLGTYLLILKVYREQFGAFLAVLSLLISTTFWSQAIIAETYTVGLFWWILLTGLIWHWQSCGTERNHLLGLTTALLVLGFGIHLYTLLLAPAIFILILYTAWQQKISWQLILKTLSIGGLSGIGCLLLSIWFLDQTGSETSIFATTYWPYRTAWALTSENFSTFSERLAIVITNPQWRGTFFKDGFLGMQQQAWLFWERLYMLEFTPLLLTAAGLGCGFMLFGNAIRRRFAGYLLLTGGLNFILAIGYATGDWYLFFLPVLLVIAIFGGIGLAWVIDLVKTHLPLPFYLLFGCILCLSLVFPYWGSRVEALNHGKATFVHNVYPYPVNDLSEPRERAEHLVSLLPDNGVIILDWRSLYSAMYVAHVEQGKTNIRFIELSPHGTSLADLAILQETLETYQEEGRPIFAVHRMTLPGYRVIWRGAYFEFVSK